MGNWGVGIFEGDNELDVREFYEQAREQGMRPHQASSVTWKRVNQPDWGFEAAKLALVKVVLAATQLVHNELLPQWRDEALGALNEARLGDCLLWAQMDDPSQINPKRQAAINEFREILLTYDPNHPFTRQTLPACLYETSLGARID
jgi:hypothetical protein